MTNTAELAHKLSKYNFFFHFAEQNQYLVYNSISNGLASLEEDIYQLLKKGDEGLAFLLDHEDPERRAIAQKLRAGNIIIDRDFDEVEFLRTKLNLVRFGLNTLLLTIVPTHDCNLDCIYCYEGSRSKLYMDPETENAVVQFVKKKITDYRYKHVHITWYGGEPLLATDTVYRLSEQLLKICKSRKVAYSASMVSNGTLLSREVVANLKKYRVKNIQVTIDGTKETHDQRRPFPGSNKSSFESIIAGVTQVLGKIPINIRINVDKTNFAGTVALLDEFKKMGWLDNRKKVFIYIGYTREWTSQCSHILENCFSMREFTEAEMKFQENLAAQGYQVGNLYPSLNSYCTAVSNHGFVVEPQGALHKCWSNVGNPDAYLGDVRTPVTLSKKLLQWLSYEPLTLFEDCRDCKFFPVCAGGCPYVAIFQREKIKNDPLYNCTPWKIFMEKKMKNFLRQKLATKETDRR